MLGRDIYSRVLYGARVSFGVGFSVAILASLAGCEARFDPVESGEARAHDGGDHRQEAQLQAQGYRGG
jgi:hypothetical protein